MISRGRLAFLSFSLATVLLVVAGSLKASGSKGRDDGADSLYKHLSVFTEVLSLVQRSYVDETDIDTLMVGAFEGTTDALDPFSLYVPAEHVEAYLAARAVGSSRSGLLMLKERGVAYAAAVEKGSPAEQAGIERGDILSRLQGRSTREMPLWEIRTLLAGPLDTQIEVERLRLGQQKTVKFKLAEFPPPGVVLEQRRGVAVLRLDGFYPDTPKNVETSLETLQTHLASGEPELPGLTTTDKLLVDLRGVAVGEEAIAYRVAELFVGGELGELKARDKTLEIFKAARPALWHGQVALLIDQGTQGAAEVLASILQQASGARLVGTESFGHSGRLGLVTLSNGGRLQITDAFFTGPNRQPITEGLTPDFEVRPRFRVPDTDDESDDVESDDVESDDVESDDAEDPVLDRGLEVLLEDEAAPAEQQAA